MTIDKLNKAQDLQWAMKDVRQKVEYLSEGSYGGEIIRGLGDYTAVITIGKDKEEKPIFGIRIPSELLPDFIHKISKWHSEKLEQLKKEFAKL